jgi:hypothetical protein
MSDSELLVTLLKPFNAYLEYDTSGQIRVTCKQPLPYNISQMSCSIGHTAETRVGDVYETGEYDYYYIFLSKELLISALILELEQRRYREFSQTFDKQVQSELGQ